MTATALELVKTSNAWDPRYNLPTLPNHNNPFIYMAYLDLAMRAYDGSQIERHLIWDFYAACEKESGLFYRWPDHGGGQISHDEVMGAAYFDPIIAKRILNYLDAHDGEFNVTGEPVDATGEKYNIYRMVWLRPYLMACCEDRPVSFISQIYWLVGLISDYFNEDAGGGKLRTYLMASKMARFPMCKFFFDLWRTKMEKKGITFKTALAIEPRENPVLTSLAPAKGWPLPGDAIRFCPRDPQFSTTSFIRVQCPYCKELV